MNFRFFFPTVAVLNGQLLISGGQFAGNNSMSSTEYYDENEQVFKFNPNMKLKEGRSGASLAIMPKKFCYRTSDNQKKLQGHMQDSSPDYTSDIGEEFIRTGSPDNDRVKMPSRRKESPIKDRGTKKIPHSFNNAWSNNADNEPKTKEVA